MKFAKFVTAVNPGHKWLFQRVDDVESLDPVDSVVLFNTFDS